MSSGAADIKFSPPVYMQRYYSVVDIIDDPRWEAKINKVADIGCSTMKLFKSLNRLKTVTTILEVDVDRDILDEYLCVVEPSNQDYINLRTCPLEVFVLEGSVASKDHNLIGCDAVVGIELIEHLDDDVLQMLPETIFGYVEPKIAILTTPNVEFNVMFPLLKDGGFRHHDHRFEWTRDEFQNWCQKIVEKYPKFSVEFHGVGPGPSGTENLGCVSQLALFINNSYQKKKNNVCYNADTRENKTPKSGEEEMETLSTEYASLNLSQETSDMAYYKSAIFIAKNENISNNEMNVCAYKDNCFYKLVAKIDFPYRVDKRSPSKKMFDEIIYQANALAIYNDCDFYNVEDRSWHVPIKIILSTLCSLNINEDIAEQILAEHGATLVNNCVVCDDKNSDDEKDDYPEDDDVVIMTDENSCPNFDENWDAFYTEGPAWTD